MGGWLFLFVWLCLVDKDLKMTSLWQVIEIFDKNRLIDV